MGMGSCCEVVHHTAESFHFGKGCRLPGEWAKDILPPRARGIPLDLYTFDKLYVDRLRNGEPSTEHHFVTYFGEIIAIMLRARYLTPERIDDIRQETLTRVIATLRRDGGIRHPERFGAFVNSICKNVLRENSRDWHRIQPLEQAHLELADKVVDLERTLISEETKKQVRGILDDMKKRDRDLLGAIFLQEKDKDEICREFGVDREYLRVLLHRAKERFRSIFIREHASFRGRTVAWLV
jgi:RNA polymerase sigma-70 factor, ECF subfamily